MGKIPLENLMVPASQEMSRLLASRTRTRARRTQSAPFQLLLSRRFGNYLRYHPQS